MEFSDISLGTLGSLVSEGRVKGKSVVQLGTPFWVDARVPSCTTLFLHSWGVITLGVCVRFGRADPINNPGIN